MSLFCVVYYISIYLFLYNNALDNHKIIIRGPNPDFASYTVQNYEPLDISLENFASVIKCKYQDRGGNIDYFNYFKTGDYNIHISQVTSMISTRWQCEVVDFNNNQINYSYSFDIRVKGARTVTVKIGRLYEVYEKTNLTMLEYDGIAKHDFEEGDIVDLTCSNRYTNGQIRIRYYGENGIILFDAQNDGTTYPLTVRILVKDKSVNQSYVECAYIAPTTLQEFTYRTVLTVLPNNNTESNNDFVVTVNGMELTPFPQKVHEKDRYLYYYTVGESVQLTCAKRTPLVLGDIYGEISIDYTKKVATKDIVRTSSMYSILIETAHLDGVIFQCLWTSESSNITVDIMFLKERVQDPVIRGLSASNVLYQFNTDDNDWIIYYQQSRKQVLNLTCITARNREPRWTYRAEINSVVNENKNCSTNYVNHVFNMEDESNKTISIICKSTKSGTKTKRMIVFVILQDGETNKAYKQVDGQNNGSPAVFNTVGIIIGAVGVVGALIIGIN